MAYDAAVSQPVKLIDGIMGGGSNPVANVADAIGRGGALWYYASVDVDSDVDAANYFTNGLDLGMKVGDIVFVFEATSNVVFSFMGVSDVTASGATVKFGAVA